MFLSKRNNNKCHKGFSLPEVVVALMILAIITSTVLVTINRYSELTVDRQLEMKAFHLARENMEKILASDSVEETLEYSSSDDYPDIHTTSVVETFYEPLTERMWIRAVCTASFTDNQEKEHTLELTHWVTDLSARQMLQVLDVREWQKKQLEKQQAEDGGAQPSADGGGTRPSADGTATTTSGVKSPTDKKDEEKLYPWLPDGWNGWSREEKLRWLLGMLRS